MAMTTSNSTKVNAEHDLLLPNNDLMKSLQNSTWIFLGNIQTTPTVLKISDLLEHHQGCCLLPLGDNRINCEFVLPKSL
jgi:hypothetical protein